MLPTGALGLTSLAGFWALDIARKKSGGGGCYFYFKQENNDSRNSKLPQLFGLWLSFWQGGHWEQGHLKFILFAAADFGKFLSLPSFSQSCFTSAEFVPLCRLEAEIALFW